MSEIDIYGVYVPALLIHGLLSYVVLQLIIRLNHRLEITTWIMMPNVFYLGLYVVLFGMFHWVFLL